MCSPYQRRDYECTAIGRGVLEHPRCQLWSAPRQTDAAPRTPPLTHRQQTIDVINVYNVYKTSLINAFIIFVNVYYFRKRHTNCHTYMQGLTDLKTLLFVFVLTTFSDNSLLCVTVYVYFVWLCNPVLRLPYTNKYDLIFFEMQKKLCRIARVEPTFRQSLG